MSRKSGIVNVRMVITEEKILSNIDKVQKLINPKSKKQIVQLEDDTYFKDLIESIKAYLIEYPKKKNFPVSVYKAAYGLVEYATTQFEENTKKVEELIRQREENIALAGKLKELVEAVENRETKLVWKDRSRKSQNYKDAIKLLNARVNNLETNLHIEIDLERTEDRSKALSYIGIEVADALKDIPKPADLIIEDNETELIQEIEEKPVKEVKVAKASKKKKANIELVDESIEEKEEEKIETVKKATKSNEKAANKQIVKESTNEEKAKGKRISQVVLIDENDEEQDEIPEELQLQEYEESVTFKKKPSLWQRIKNSKLGRAVSFVLKIKVRIEFPALPEGRDEE